MRNQKNRMFEMNHVTGQSQKLSGVLNENIGMFGTLYYQCLCICTAVTLIV
jgi:hypothetical protein